MAAFWTGLIRGMIAIIPFARRMKAERDAGASPELAQQDRAESLLDSALRRLGSIQHNDPIWQRLGAETAAVFTRPEQFSKPHVREWLSDPLTAQNLKLIARALLVSAPEPKGARETLVTAYMKISGEYKSSAIDHVHIAVTYLKASAQAAANDSGVAALTQTGFQTVHEQLNGIHKIVDELISNQEDNINSNSPNGVGVDIPLSLAELIEVAQALLDAGSPPSLSALYPDAPMSAYEALNSLSSIERWLVEAALSPGETPKRCILQSLATTTELKNLFIGQPGSGKTHALWKMAHCLLQDGEIIPLFLPVGRLSTWEEILNIITDTCPSISPDRILRDSRICVCIDGWSEFAMGENVGERTKALRVLRGTRIIANGRQADIGDTMLNTWTLEPFSQLQVSNTLAMARKDRTPPSNDLLDLLRLPLLLNLFILSDGKASGIGELLRQFHNHLSRNLPEEFSEALCRAVAVVDLAGDRSYGRLISELQSRAKEVKISEPTRILESLGSIINRSGQAVPVHDLYWSWLCGCGLLLGIRTEDAITSLRTRESYTLALQSGRRVDTSLIAEVMGNDVILAAEFDASIGSKNQYPALAEALGRGLTDHRLAIRSRAALASLKGLRPQHFLQALEILSELSSAKLIQRDWLEVLHPSTLFTQRGALSEWLGSAGSDIILEAIATQGGPEWVNWLEQMAESKKITWVKALEVALACRPVVPLWGLSRLDDLFSMSPWRLRLVAARRSNNELALIIANDYERIIEKLIPQGSSGWIDVNRVLVSCGDDEVFNNLLIKFSSMSPKSQESLGYAIIDRGGAWISRFQRVAFSVSSEDQHHKLAEVVSADIDDETARNWIAAGHEKMGWRVLISRHGERMLPELIASLPASFENIHKIPSLEYMYYLEGAPETLIEEIWSRVKGKMQPKAMQDVLYALSKVEPLGMASIVRFVMNTPNALPAYHMNQILRLYEDWRKKFGLEIRVKVSENDLSLKEWIVSYYAFENWDPHFTPSMLSRSPDIAIDLILVHLQQDDERVEAVLRAIKSVKSYNPELFERMISSAKLAALVPSVFADCLDTFPETALQLSINSPHINQSDLLYRLSSTNNPLHSAVHAQLIRRVLDSDIDIHRYRYISNMLRAYPHHDLLNILEKFYHPEKNNCVWLLREIEIARNELLLNEDGQLLP